MSTQTHGRATFLDGIGDLEEAAEANDVPLVHLPAVQYDRFHAIVPNRVDGGITVVSRAKPSASALPAGHSLAAAAARANGLPYATGDSIRAERDQAAVGVQAIQRRNIEFWAARERPMTKPGATK